MSRKLFNLFLILSLALAWASPGLVVHAQEPSLTFSPETLPNAVYGQDYEQNITVSGGIGPYRFFQNPGDPTPSDMHFNSTENSDTTSFYGTPNWVGWGGVFTLEATDLGGSGLSGKVTYSFAVIKATPEVNVEDVTIPANGPYSPIPLVASIIRPSNPSIALHYGTMAFSVDGVAIPDCGAVDIIFGAAEVATCYYTPSSSDVGKTIHVDYTPSSGTGEDFYNASSGEGQFNQGYVVSGLVFWDQDLDGVRDADTETPIFEEWSAELSSNGCTGSVAPAGIQYNGTFAFSVMDPTDCDLTLTFNMGNATNYWQTTTVDPFQLHDDKYFEIGFGHMELSPNYFPAAAKNTAYNGSIKVIGGQKPYASLAITDPLPPGLSAGSDLEAGTITLSGTPTAIGTFWLTVAATDGAGHSWAAEQASLDILPLVINPPYLPNGELGQSYEGSFTVTGGTPPYSLSIGGHLFPAGVDYTFDQATGVFAFYGTPTEAGSFGMDFTVRDSTGLSIDRGIGFLIKTDLTFTLLANPNPSPAGQPVTLSLSAAGLANIPPGGVVTFYADGVKILGCDQIPLLQGEWESQIVDFNPAVCKTSVLSAGDHTITADFVERQEGEFPPIYNDAQGIAMSDVLVIGDAPTWSIGGYVKMRGEKEGESETSLPGATVSIDWGCDGGQEDDRAITNDEGRYLFANLQAGLDYCLSVKQAHLKQLSGPDPVSNLSDHQALDDFLVSYYDLTVTLPEDFPPMVFNQDYNQVLIVSGGVEPYTINGVYSQLPTGLALTTSTDGDQATVTISGKASVEGEIGGNFYFYINLVDAHGVQFHKEYQLFLEKSLNLALHSVFNPSGEGQDIALYATVDGYSMDKLPAGRVHFFVDGGEYTGCQGDQNLDIIGGAPAVCIISGGLAQGDHTISITYEDFYRVYAGVSEPLTQAVKPSYTITVDAFNDTDGDGTKDDGEPVMDNGYFKLDQGCDGTVEDYQAGYGSQTFEYFAGGECYRVSVDQQVGWYLTTAQTVEITSLTGNSTVSFGFKSRVLSLNPAVLPPGELDVPYSQALAITGNTGMASITLASGALPAGLALADGVISGTPSEAGAFHIRLALTDSANPDSVEYWDYDLKILTDALTLDLSAYPDYDVDNPNAVRLVLGATGLPGYPPFGMVVFKDNGQPIYGCEEMMLYEGLLWGPVPFDMNPVICDAMLEPGYHEISAEFTNSTEGNLSIYKDAAIALENPILIGLGFTPAVLPDGHMGQPYSQSVTMVGGTPPYTFRVGSEDELVNGQTGESKFGLSYQFNSDGTFTIAGTPTQVGNFFSDIYVTDSTGKHIELQFRDGLAINTDAIFQLTSSKNPSDAGEEVTFSFSATGTFTPPNFDRVVPPDGYVTFYDGDPANGGIAIADCENLHLYEETDDQGNVIVDQNPVTCATSSLTSGQHVIVATFTGGWSPYADATRTLEQQVGTLVDITPPVITPHITGDPGQNGWYTGDVTLKWTVSDAESAVTSSTGCDDVSITSDQAKTDYTCTATSGGGEAYATASIGRDTASPTVTITPDRSADQNGWYNQTIGFTVTGEDATSGNVTCGTLPDYSSPDGGDLSVAGSCTDEAGNTGSESLSFKYDATPPAVTVAPDRAPDSNDWYNAPVTFTFTKSDATSGLVLTSCDPDQTYSGPDTANMGMSGSCQDNAGNSGYSDVIYFKYDATAPLVAVTGVANGASYPVGTVPTAGCSTSDTTSGVKTQATVSVTGGDPGSVGSHTATCSGGVDNANNTSAPVSATYTVTAPVSTDLSLTNTDSKDPIKVGASLVYTLVVRNAGLGAAQTVTVVDTLDKDTTYSSVSAPKGWSCTFNSLNKKVTCTAASMANNASATIKITVTVNKTAKVGSQLSNIATVSSVTNDPNTANNTATQKTTVSK